MATGFQMIICMQRQLKRTAININAAIGKSALPGKRADQDWAKVMTDHRIRESSFTYFQLASIEIDRYFRQLWGEKFTLVVQFH